MVYVVLLVCFIFSRQVFMQEETKVTDLIEALFEQYNNSTINCIQDSNVNEVLVNKFIKTGDLNEDSHFACFLKCFLMRSGLIDNNGKILAESIKQNTKLVDATVVDALSKKCRIHQGNSCYTAVDIVKCSVDFVKSALRRR